YGHEDPKRPDLTYGRRASVIDGFTFDWAKRRIPKSAYESSDLVHWLALETALDAIQDAGVATESLPRERMGVIVGNTLTGALTRSGTLRLRWPFVRRALRAAASASGFDEGTLALLESEMENRFKAVFPPVTEDTLAGGLSNTVAGRICNFLDLRGGGYTVDG